MVTEARRGLPVVLVDTVASGSEWAVSGGGGMTKETTLRELDASTRGGHLRQTPKPAHPPRAPQDFYVILTSQHLPLLSSSSDSHLCC